MNAQERNRVREVARMSRIARMAGMGEEEKRERNRERNLRYARDYYRKKREDELNMRRGIQERDADLTRERTENRELKERINQLTTELLNITRADVLHRLETGTFTRENLQAVIEFMENL